MKLTALRLAQSGPRRARLADDARPGRPAQRPVSSLDDLRDRLTGADWYEDEDYTAYGLTFAQVEELKAWALEWAEDLGARIHDENA